MAQQHHLTATFGHAGPLTPNRAVRGPSCILFAMTDAKDDLKTEYVRPATVDGVLPDNSDSEPFQAPLPSQDETEPATAKDVRSWAKENGYNDIKSRGRLPGDVVRAYSANNANQPVEDQTDES